jgi:hypothetical protein
MAQDSAQKLSVEKMTKKNDLTGRFALGGLGKLELATNGLKVENSGFYFCKSMT